MEIRDPKHPQHYTNKALFNLYTWWASVEHQPRVFVIVRRIHEDNGDIKAIELLEKDKEAPIERPYEEFFNLFQQGKLQRTSTMNFITN